MCKVVKDYGIVAEKGSKTLNLQIVVIDKENKLALVSYKDGMSVNIRDLTKDDAKKLKELLEGYLGYKAKVVEENVSEEMSKIVHTLITVPSGDRNYQTALKEATKEDLEEAIKRMKADKNGRHSTRIKTCEAALNKASIKFTSKATKAEAKAEEKAKVITFPTEDKKPNIIQLKTEGDRSYGECVVKAKKEMEMFKDSDSQYVLEALLELCKVNGDFRNNFMREDKTYGGFMEYMFNAAKNGYCVKYGNVGWLDRDLGLGLAIDYYNADCDKMKKAENKAKEDKTNGKNKSKKKGRASA